MKPTRSKYKQQDDRLLKRLPLSERRRQERLRAKIMNEMMVSVA